MNKKKFFLSIDNGLTMGKAALVDFEGNIIGIESFKNEVINDGFYSEVDMDLLSGKTFSVIKRLLEKTGIDPSDIISIGNSGHGGGIYALDKSGNPVRNAITSMDPRAAGQIEKWKKEGINGYSKTYAHMWNGQAIPLLYWLKENEKNNYEKINKVLFCKDWIKFKLTGKCSTDYTDACNAGLINLHIKDYDPELYKLYAMEDMFSKLPELKNSAEVMGYVNREAAIMTGLKEGTPVISGFIDLVACVIGSGIYNERAYSVISGTWNINAAISNNLVENPYILAWLLLDDEKNFLAKDTSPTSAVNLEWFLSEVIEKMGVLKLNRKQIYLKIDEEINNLKISNSNSFYYPFIHKSKLSKKMEGSFYGFNASQDVYNLIYAIYEGVAFAHFMHIRNLRKGGILRNSAVLSGGAANSSLWCQMFSDVLNIEISTTSTNEVGILGLAICQSLGMGIYMTPKDAIARLVRVKSVFKPDSTKNAFYMERFTEFERIMQLLES